MMSLDTFSMPRRMKTKEGKKDEDHIRLIFGNICRGKPSHIHEVYVL